MKIENKRNARFLSSYNVNFLAAKIKGEKFCKILKKKDRQSHKGKKISPSKYICCALVYF